MMTTTRAVLLPTFVAAAACTTQAPPAAKPQPAVAPPEVAASGAGSTASAPASASGSASASTLDPRIQGIAREELASAVAAWSASRGVVVVLDVKTGDVLAAAGRVDGRADDTLASQHAWITGSTLKTLTVAAALEEHTITLDQRFKCGTRTYGEKTLRDAADGPCTPLDAAGLLAKSSNVASSYVFDTLGAHKLMPWLRKLHIGDPPGELPVVDDDRDMRGALLAGGELATATPLQVAAAYAAIFNDGVYVAPSIGRAAPASARVLTTETVRALVPMLEATLQGEGTGKAARVAGARVAGKTGTAAWPDASGKEMYYASFVGTVLDREPRIVALVGLEAPAARDANGPKAAAPLWSKVATRIVGGR